MCLFVSTCLFLSTRVCLLVHVCFLSLCPRGLGLQFGLNLDRSITIVSAVSHNGGGLNPDSSGLV